MLLLYSPATLSTNLSLLYSLFGLAGTGGWGDPLWPPPDWHLSHFMCHISHVMCHMSHVTFHISLVACKCFFFFFADKLVKLVIGGSAISRVYPSSFLGFSSIGYFVGCLLYNFIQNLCDQGCWEKSYCKLLTDRKTSRLKSGSYLGIVLIGNTPPSFLGSWGYFCEWVAIFQYRQQNGVTFKCLALLNLVVHSIAPAQ